MLASYIPLRTHRQTQYVPHIIGMNFHNPLRTTCIADSIIRQSGAHNSAVGLRNMNRFHTRSKFSMFHITSLQANGLPLAHCGFTIAGLEADAPASTGYDALPTLPKWCPASAFFAASGNACCASAISSLMSSRYLSSGVLTLIALMALSSFAIRVSSAAKRSEKRSVSPIITPIIDRTLVAMPNLACVVMLAPIG